MSSGGRSLDFCNLVQDGSEDQQLAVWHGDVTANPGVKERFLYTQTRGKLTLSNEFGSSL